MRSIRAEDNPNLVHSAKNKRRTHGTYGTHHETQTSFTIQYH